jgi:hypothetical protein
MSPEEMEMNVLLTDQSFLMHVRQNGHDPLGIWKNWREAKPHRETLYQQAWDFLHVLWQEENTLPPGIIRQLWQELYQDLEH